MNTIANLGARLARLRKQAGLSPQQLAERSQVSYRTLYRVEDGIIPVSLVLFERAFAALGYDLVWSLRKRDNGDRQP